MNNLKFRAWHKEYKAMMYFDLITQENVIVSNEKIYINFIKDCLSERGPESVCAKFHKLIPLDDPQLIIMHPALQNCRDKNGNHIYEDDLVSDSDGEIYQIILLDGSFLIQAKLGQIMEIYWSELKIIGNIHEGTKESKLTKPRVISLTRTGTRFPNGWQGECDDGDCLYIYHRGNSMTYEKKRTEHQTVGCFSFSICYISENKSINLKKLMELTEKYLDWSSLKSYKD